MIIYKGTESTHFVKRGTGIPERQNERPMPYFNRYDTFASYIPVFLENYQFSLYKLYENKLNEINSFNII